MTSEQAAAYHLTAGFVAVELYRASQSRVRELEAELAIWKMRMKALVGEDSPDMAGNRIIELKAERDRLKAEVLAEQGFKEQAYAVTEQLRARHAALVGVAGRTVLNNPHTTGELKAALAEVNG
jgi:hypothetical protein